MPRSLLKYVAAVLLAGGTLLACSERPSSTAPRAPGQGVARLDSQWPGSETVSKSKRIRSMASDVTVTAFIGPKGGEITIPRAGFKLTVPKGAVRTVTAFTVTALAGSGVAYEFGPHGTVFNVPLLATQDLANDGGVQGDASNGNGSNFSVGYFTDRSAVSTSDSTAVVSESRSAVTDKTTGKIGFQISHFSGYILSTGLHR